MKESIFIFLLVIGMAIILISCSGKANNQDVFLPYGFQKGSNNEEKFPLIVTLHGATERKDFHYIPEILKDSGNVKNTPFFIYALQC